jgi:WhiB family redox-sensing transcriptional regulator
MNEKDYEFNWFEGAKCLGEDPDLWFPDNHEEGHEARKVCFQCPVRIQCYDYAIEKKIHHGIWGGRDFEKKNRKKINDNAHKLTSTVGREQAVCLAPHRRDVHLSYNYSRSVEQTIPSTVGSEASGGVCGGQLEGPFGPAGQASLPT